MIGKVSPRGSRVAGLIYYLFGPGRNEEHTDPHIVAGWRAPRRTRTPARATTAAATSATSPGCSSSPRPRSATRGFARPVWHCSVRAAPGDRMLSDDEWAAGRLRHHAPHRPRPVRPGRRRGPLGRGPARRGSHPPRGDAGPPGRTRPRLWNDYYRVGEACRAAEQRFGLRQTAPARPYRGPPPDPRGVGEGRAAAGCRRPPASHSGGRSAPPPPGRPASRSSSPGWTQAGVLVRKRFSTRNPGEVTGYAVALTGDTTRDGWPGVVRRREARRGPDPAQAPLPLGPRPAPGPPSDSPRPSGTRSGSMPPAPRGCRGPSEHPLHRPG